MVALGYEEHIYITFSVTPKASTHTSELQTVKENINQEDGWKPLEKPTLTELIYIRPVFP